MKKSALKKKKLELPSDFQELLISEELEIAKKITVLSIQKLVYLYTIGMDYYNIAGKAALQQFYNDKLIGLLTKQDIIEFLDKNKVDFSKTDDLDLFKKDSSDSTKTTYSVFFHEEVSAQKKPMMTKQELLDRQCQRRKTYVAKDPSQKINDKEIKEKIEAQIKQVDAKISKINERLTESLVIQMSEFEEKRRKMKVRGRKNSVTKRKNSLVKPSDPFFVEEIIPGDKYSTPNLEPLLRRQSMKRRVSIGGNSMIKEIEEYVEKNMAEMFKALDELKATFESEIADAESNGFPDIATSLQDDMNGELEILKDQYEEQRRVETEKIRNKHQGKSAFSRS